MIDLLASPEFPRSAALIAIAAWMTIAVWNNRTDRETNVFLLGTMFRMDLLRDEKVLGQGLSHRRAEGNQLAQTALAWVIRAQFLIAALLWAAASFSTLDWLGMVNPTTATAAINLAVGAFFALWTTFLCGGLYFGYWIKTWHVQQVHFTLFIIGLLLWQMSG